MKEDGTRVMKTASLLVVPKGKCLVTNKATGTWIGDDHPAWRRDK